MSKQCHRTCVRISAEEYALLKKKSKAAGLSANAWLMEQLKSNRPMLYREQEMKELVAFMNEAGREINDISRDFNSGYVTVQQLRLVYQRQAEIYERLYALRMMGYPHAK